MVQGLVGINEARAGNGFSRNKSRSNRRANAMQEKKSQTTGNVGRSGGGGTSSHQNNR